MSIRRSSTTKRKRSGKRKSRQTTVAQPITPIIIQAPREDKKKDIPWAGLGITAVALGGGVYIIRKFNSATDFITDPLEDLYNLTKDGAGLIADAGGAILGAVSDSGEWIWDGITGGGSILVGNIETFSETNLPAGYTLDNSGNLVDANGNLAVDFVPTSSIWD